MTTQPKPGPSRQTRVNRFMRAAMIGAGAWIATFALQMVGFVQEASPILTWTTYAVFLLYFGALIVQFFYRKADEFTSTLWYSSASTAFICTLGFMLFGTQAEYWANAAWNMATGAEVRTGYAYWFSFTVPPLSFYLTFLFRLWKDR